jgi:uncharacterized repeat protein (TIGR03803 family)
MAVLFGVSLSVPAQVFTTEYAFTNTPDGANPRQLTWASGLFYAATANGGANGSGSIFTFDTNSETLTIIYSFTGETNNGSSPNNVLVAGNMIYGTAAGGTNYNGMIYGVGTNGTGFTGLYSFGPYPDGQEPEGGLILSGATLYGTTFVGGVGMGGSSGGTIFEINTNGAGYSVIHSFTNSPDGAQPQGQMVLANGVLYGATTYGGTNGFGAIFAINTDGSSYTILRSFTNSPDPNYPYGGLVLSGGVLYGTASGGGSNFTGAIFAINTNGSGYDVLHDFSGYAGNTDGIIPKGMLSVSGGYLYGTATSGGSGGSGTLFLINTNGTGFAVVESFTNSANIGSDPLDDAVRVGSSLWGTTYQGGAGDEGTLFRLPLPVLTTQPQSLTVTNANPAAFSVTAADDSSISYQWYFNTNALLAGQTNNTLALAGATNNNAGAYTVVASDNYGSVTSSPALLTVFSKPVLTRNPQDVVVTNGDPVSFSAAATGPGSLSFQWYFQTNTVLAGATNTSLTFTNAITNLAGYYSVRVTNTFGPVTSSYALLVVSNQLHFLSFTFSPGNGSASFAVANLAQTTNRLWATTNLACPAGWQVIATNIMATNGLWFFTDPNTAKSNLARFYRFSSP